MSTSAAGPSTTSKKRRQQASSPRGNDKRKGLKKRARRAPQEEYQWNIATSSSPRDKSPIPLVQSDIANAIPNPKPKRTRNPSRRLRESRDDGTDGTATRRKASIQSTTSSTDPREEHGERGSELNGVRGLKDRIAKLEEERDDYREKCQRQEKNLMEQGAKLLMMAARVTPRDAEVTILGDTTLVDCPEEDPSETDRQCGNEGACRKGRTGQPTKVERYRMAQATEDAFATSAYFPEEQAVKKPLQEKGSLQSARILQLENEIEELTTSHDEEKDVWQKEILKSEQKLQEEYQASVNKLEERNKEHDKQIKTIVEKCQKLELRSAKLQDEVTQLRADASIRNDLQNQVDEARKSLEKAGEDGARQRKALSEQVIGRKADLVRLDKVEHENRRLETEKTERDEKLAVLEKEVARLRERGKKHEETLKQLNEVEAKNDSLKKEMDTMAKTNEDVLEEEKARHTRDLGSLKQKNVSLQEALEIAASLVVQQTGVINDLKAQKDTLGVSLKAKGQEATRLHNQLQTSEAEVVALTRQRGEHTEQVRKLEAEAKDLRDDLKAKHERLERTIPRCEEYQRKMEQFAACVKSQIVRKLEDEKGRPPDLESAIERATIENVQELLTLKLDNLEHELRWYQQQYQKKRQQHEDKEARLQTIAASALRMT